MFNAGLKPLLCRSSRAKRVGTGSSPMIQTFLPCSCLIRHMAVVDEDNVLDTTQFVPFFSARVNRRSHTLSWLMLIAVTCPDGFRWKRTKPIPPPLNPSA